MFSLKQLKKAIKETNLTLISKILAENPAFLISIDDDKSSLLHWIATDHDHQDIEEPQHIINYLLNNYSININQQAYQGMTALHEATTCEKIEIVEVLLKNRAKIIGNAEQWTALHLAANRNYTAIAELLLNYGADPYAKTKDGDTPCHLAATENDDASIFNLLLETVASPCELLLIENNRQHTPLNLALSQANFSESEKNYYIKIALLGNQTLKIPDAVSENPSLLEAWNTYLTEISGMQAEPIAGTRLSLYDLAKTIDIDTFSKSTIKKIDIRQLATMIENFIVYKDSLIVNIHKLNFLKKFINEKIADSYYSVYDIYQENNEQKLAIIFSNRHIEFSVLAYLANIDSSQEIPFSYKQKITKVLRQRCLAGVRRQVLLHNLLEDINQSPEEGGPLPNEMKNEILSYLSTTQLKNNEILIQSNLASTSFSSSGLSRFPLFKRPLSQTDSDSEEEPAQKKIRLTERA